MAYPKDYKYTKEHEWIQVKGNTGHGWNHGPRAGVAGRHRVC